MEKSTKRWNLIPQDRMKKLQYDYIGGAV